MVEKHEDCHDCDMRPTPQSTDTGTVFVCSYTARLEEFRMRYSHALGPKKLIIDHILCKSVSAAFPLAAAQPMRFHAMRATFRRRCDDPLRPITRAKITSLQSKREVLH